MWLEFWQFMSPVGKVDYLYCQRGLFWAPPRHQLFLQMAQAQHMRMRMRKCIETGVSPSFPLQLKTTDACKTAVLAVKMIFFKFNFKRCITISPPATECLSGFR